MSRIVILGAGNGGCAAAADLTIRGHSVALYDLPAQKIDIAQAGEQLASLLNAEREKRGAGPLVIALPAGLRFRYRPGMHVELITPDVGKPRTYSIATAPDADGLSIFFGSSQPETTKR